MCLRIAKVEGVDDHADVGRVLARLTHVRNVDQFECSFVHGFLERFVPLPVAIRLLDHDTALDEQAFEHALDINYAEKLGVDVENLLVSQPDTGEQALEIAEVLVRSGAVDIVVIDSVAALVPRAEIEGEMSASHVGLQARLMSQALRKLAGTINRSDTTAVFINQIREKIGVMFGNPETTPGGRALKFYSSTRIEIRRIESIKDGSEVIGNRVRAKVVKNKVAPPFRQAEFDIMFGKGISREGSLIDVAVESDIVRKSGAWYTFDGDQLGQGRENAKRFLNENPEIAVQLQARVLAAVGLAGAEEAPEPEEADAEPAPAASNDEGEVTD